MVHVVQNTQNWVISVVVLQRTARKCTKISNARAELLFCSLSLLFGDVLVAVAVVVCVSSLFFYSRPPSSRPRIKNSKWSLQNNRRVNSRLAVTRMDTPKSETRWKIGTHFYIMCYPHYEMKANHKQTRVKLTTSKPE